MLRKNSPYRVKVRIGRVISYLSNRLALPDNVLIKEARCFQDNKTPGDKEIETYREYLTKQLAILQDKNKRYVD